MKQRELVLNGIKILEQAGVPEAEVDAVLLWKFLSGQSGAAYLLAAQDEVEEEMCRSYQEVIARRAMRIPLQQITGTQSFFGYEFAVAEDVLIPRYDTEVLVEQADRKLEEISKDNLRVLDLCCGSGCIGISLALKHPELHVDLADVSEAAVHLAEQNAIRLGADADVIKSDLFENIEDRYDMIISNPPYIEAAVIDGLMPEVRNHEPRLALDGGADGLEFYRKIAGQAGRYLNEDGWLLLEIGDRQAHDVQRFLVDAGFSKLRTVKDLANRDRVVMGQKTSKSR